MRYRMWLGWGKPPQRFAWCNEKDGDIMLRFIVGAALAPGVLVLWSAILPLSAQPMPAARTPSIASPDMSDALLPCRTQNGIDRACAVALAKALLIERPERDAMPAADRVCRPEVKLSRRSTWRGVARQNWQTPT